MRRRTVLHVDDSNHNDEWPRFYRALAVRLADVLQPSEETAEALLAVAHAQELLALYEEELRPLLDEDESDRRALIRREMKLLDQARDALRSDRGAMSLRNGISRLHGHADADLFLVTTRILRERIGGAGAALPELPEIVRRLCALLGLSREVGLVLALLYALRQVDEIDSTVNTVADRLRIQILADVCELDAATFTEIIGEDGEASRLGLLERPRRGMPRMDQLEIDRSVNACFGSGSLEPITGGLFEPERSARYPLDAFPVPAADLRFLRAALRDRRPVLLYGAPGIGKTEFAHALGETMQRRVRTLRADGAAREEQPERQRFRRLSRAARLVDRDRDLLLVDEADSMLGGGGGLLALLGNAGPDKAELNAVLENIHLPCIFIANRADAMPDSALRRFGYVFRFPRPRVATRERVLKERLAEHDLPVDDTALRRIAAGYDLSPSAIDRMVRTVTAVAGEEGLSTAAGADGGDRSAQGAELYRHMEEYLSVTSRGALGRETRRLPAAAGHFDPGLCNAAPGATTLLERLDRRARAGRSSRLLFHGPPGGGKTELASYLAGALGREAVIRRPSDLLSPYVGVSEQQVAAMFREAAGEETVLILDEADALLADRAGAVRSWEITRAAEFLQGLQDFEGILIACTNRLDGVDPALRRRFHQLVAFGPLRPEQFRPALERFFPQVAWSAAALAELEAGPPVMMSDIANAADLLGPDDEMPEDPAPAGKIIAEIRAGGAARGEGRGIGFRAE